MAKKTAAKKKTTTTKKAGTKKVTSVGPVGLYKEKCPQDHVATGKYKGLFIFLGVSMVLFAAVAVQLLLFSIDVENKYESIKACARNHTSCEIRVTDTEEKE